jgi:hypothetical protein
MHLHLERQLLEPSAQRLREIHSDYSWDLLVLFARGCFFRVFGVRGMLTNS